MAPSTAGTFNVRDYGASGRNCVITGANRGIAFMVFDGGVVENVVLANLTVDCQRYDRFWWGDGDPLHFNLIQRSEIDPNLDFSASRRPTGPRGRQWSSTRSRAAGARQPVLI
jgi:hypothetical protein